MAEYLVIDARLNRDGTLALRRSYTTEQLQHRSEPQRHDAEPLTAVAVDRAGDELTRGRLRRFEPPEPGEGPPRYKVRGELSLPRNAAAVHILDGEREVGVFDLDDAPDVAVSVKTAKEYAGVVIEHSDPTTQAWMAISLFTDGQAARTLYVGPPTQEYEFELSSTYGEQAAVGVLYSTGTRSAAAMSEPIDLPRNPVPLTIVEPMAKATFTPWDVIDARAGLSSGFAEAHEVLTSVAWTVDDERAGTGHLIAVGPLKPGRHTITASVDGSDHCDPASESVEITVRAPGGGKSAKGS